MKHSNNNDTRPKAHEILLQADSLQAALSVLLPDGSLRRELESALNTLREDISQLVESRSPDKPVIAIVGPKNSGKSTLAASLIDDPNIVEKLKCGVTPDCSTKLLVWIGDTAPRYINTASELYIHCPAERMTGLDKPYALLDTPGFNDDFQTACKLATSSIKAADIKLFVMRQSEIDNATIIKWGRLLDGSTVIPVVIIEDDSDQTKLQTSLYALREKLRNNLPRADVANTLILSNHYRDEREKSIRDIRLKLAERLRPILAQPHTNRIDSELEARWERFQITFGQLVEPIRESLEEPFMAWEGKRQENTSNIIRQLIGNSEATQAAVTMELRLRLIRETPAVFFPHRMILTLLTIATGKWDRLSLGAIGSLPSMIMAAAGSAGNIKRHQQFRMAMRKGIQSRMLGKAKQDSVESRHLHNAIRKFRAQHHAADTSPPEPAPRKQARCSGLDETTEALNELWVAKLNEARPVKAAAFTAGALGSGIFLGFLAGPLYAAYREFFSAWGQGSIQIYPAGVFAVTATGLLLSILPLVIFGMLQLAVYPGKKQLNNLEKSIREAFQKEIEERMQNGSLKLEDDIPLFDAVATILRKAP